MSLDPLSNIVSALERAQIIPDVIPASAGFVPTHLFSIVYPTKEVMLGNVFTKDETQEEPIVSFEPMNMPVEQADNTGDGQESSYTLAMFDPDVPSREKPEFKSFRHWVVSASKYW